MTRTELLIRPGHQQHRAVGNVLTPGGGAARGGFWRPPVSYLVLDAPLAARQRSYVEDAERVGVPVLVDPLTYLVAAELAPDAPWVVTTGFGTAEPRHPASFVDPRVSADFVADVVKFQVEKGATTIIPPYAYATSPEDPWFQQSLEWMALTVRVMKANGLNLPVAPVFCGALQGFAPATSWRAGIDEFVLRAMKVEPSFLGICFGPLGTGHESYRKIHGAFTAFRHLKASGAKIIAWRQGSYGLALSAAGLDGYECGIGLNERVDIRGAISRQKPRANAKKSSGGGGGRLYLEPLGTSVSKRVAEALLGGDMNMRAKVMCDDPMCCPHGVQSTLDNGWEHTVRSRGRELGTLDALPGAEWRLNQTFTKTQGWLTLRKSANRALAREDLNQLPVSGLDALVRVLDDIRRQERQVAA